MLRIDNAEFIETSQLLPNYVTSGLQALKKIIVTKEFFEII